MVFILKCLSHAMSFISLEMICIQLAIQLYACELFFFLNISLSEMDLKLLFSKANCAFPITQLRKINVEIK